MQHLIGSSKTKSLIEPMDSFLGTNFHKTTTSKIKKGIPFLKNYVFLEKNLQNFKNFFLEKALHVSTQCLVLKQILTNFGQCFLQTCCQLVQICVWDTYNDATSENPKRENSTILPFNYCCV